MKQFSTLFLRAVVTPAFAQQTMLDLKNKAFTTGFQTEYLIHKTHSMRLFYMMLIFPHFLSSSVYSQTTSQKQFVTVHGEVTRPLSLYAEDLAKMKQVTVSMKGKDARMHRFSGVSLLDILAQAGAATGKQLRGENMSKYLLVKCADGYQVLFSLAELDSSFTDRKVALVCTAAGKPLPAEEGPFRLVVSGEKKPARSCRQVTEMVISSAKQ